MSYQEKLDNITTKLIDILVQFEITSTDAKEYIDKWILHFVEYKTWTLENLTDLNKIYSDKLQLKFSNKIIEDYIPIEKKEYHNNFGFIQVNKDPLLTEIANLIKNNELTFAELAKINFDKDEDLDEDDIKSLIYFENICNDGCPVTEEHKNLMGILIDVGPNNPEFIIEEQINRQIDIDKRYERTSKILENRETYFDHKMRRINLKPLTDDELKILGVLKSLVNDEQLVPNDQIKDN